MASAWGTSFGGAFGSAFGAIEIVSLPPVSGVVEGMGFKSARDWVQDISELEVIYQEDQVAAELLVTLVTQGFFHGTFNR